MAGKDKLGILGNVGKRYESRSVIGVIAGVWGVRIGESSGVRVDGVEEGRVVFNTVGSIDMAVSTVVSPVLSTFPLAVRLFLRFK